MLYKKILLLLLLLLNPNHKLQIKNYKLNETLGVAEINFFISWSGFLITSHGFPEFVNFALSWSN